MSTNFGLNLGAVYVANKDPVYDSIPVTINQSQSQPPLNVTLVNNTDTTVFPKIKLKIDATDEPLSVQLKIPDQESQTNPLKVVVTAGGDNLGASSLIAGAKLNGTVGVVDTPENLTSISNSISNYKVHSLATTQITQTKNIVILGGTGTTGNYTGDAVASPSSIPDLTDSVKSKYVIKMIDNINGIKYNRINLMGQLTSFSSDSSVYKPNATAASTLDSVITNSGSVAVQYVANIYIWYSNDGIFWFNTSLGPIRFGPVSESASGYSPIGDGSTTVPGSSADFSSATTLTTPIQFSRDWETAAKYVALTFDTNFTGTVLCSLSQ